MIANVSRRAAFVRSTAALVLFSATVLSGSLAAAGARTSRSAIDPDILTITALEDRRDASAELKRFLTDSRAGIRARAALAVGRIGRASDVSVLTPLLVDADVEVRRAAAFGLGEIEDSTAAMPLAGLLEGGKEPDADVRAIAVEALGKLRGGEEACRLAFRDASADVRERAFLAAWQIPVRGMLDDVLTHLDDAPRVHWAASYCLMRMMGVPASGATPIARTTALEPAERTKATAALLGLVHDPDANVRHQAVRGLATALDPQVTQALRPLAADPDWRVRVEAARALATKKTEGEEPRQRDVHAPDFALLLADPNANVVAAAAEALGRAGPASEAKPVLLKLLDGAPVRVQEVAFGALVARWRDEEKAPQLAAEVDRVCRDMAARDAWVLRAAVPDAADLLPEQSALDLLAALAVDEPRVAKLAVGPLLRHRAQAVPADSTRGLWPVLAADVEPFLHAKDAFVRYMTLSGISDLFLADSLYHPVPADWDHFEDVLEAAYRASSQTAGEPSDVREGVVDICSNWPKRPRMDALLQAACRDSSYVVRRAAIAKVHPLRGSAENGFSAIEAEPVETGRRAADYAPILEWARGDHWAVWKTVAGTIVAKLFTEDAPLTTWNFKGLANEGFYDHGAWHRVVPNFVLQDGCPRGDGWGGPPWQIRCEINRRRYEPGRLGMALSGKDTGGSQYFFTHSPQPHLDGRYTIFGEIVSGMDVATRVTQGMSIESVRVVDVAP